MDETLLLDGLSADFQEALEPPAGKAERFPIPPEIIKLIVEKVLVNVIGAIMMGAGGAAWKWWKGRKQDLAEVKGRPTPELAAQSHPLIDEIKAQIVAELAKTPPQQLKPPDGAELVNEIRAVLHDFNFSDAEADRVANAMAHSVVARLVERR